MLFGAGDRELETSSCDGSRVRLRMLLAYLYAVIIGAVKLLRCFWKLDGVASRPMVWTQCDDEQDCEYGSVIANQYSYEG